MYLNMRYIARICLFLYRGSRRLQPIEREVGAAQRFLNYPSGGLDAAYALSGFNLSCNTTGYVNYCYNNHRRWSLYLTNKTPHRFSNTSNKFTTMAVCQTLTYIDMDQADELDIYHLSLGQFCAHHGFLLEAVNPASRSCCRSVCHEDVERVFAISVINLIKTRKHQQWLWTLLHFIS